MRQAVIRFNLIGSAAILGITSGLFDALFMFILFGVIPGSDVPLSPDQMLLLVSFMTLVVLIGLMHQRILRQLPKLVIFLQPLVSKLHLPQA